MKCIRRIETGIIERLYDDIAANAVKAGKAVYVPKVEWKKVRENASKAVASTAQKKTHTKLRSRRQDFEKRGARTKKAGSKRSQQGKAGVAD